MTVYLLKYVIFSRKRLKITDHLSFRIIESCCFSCLSTKISPANDYTTNDYPYLFVFKQQQTYNI